MGDSVYFSATNNNQLALIAYQHYDYSTFEFDEEVRARVFDSM